MHEGGGVEAAGALRIRVAGAAAAAFGEEHDRNAPPLRNGEQPVLLLMIAQPLRAGEHRVVVRHRDDARLLVGEFVAVRAAQAHHKAITRRALDQLLHGVAAQAAGDNKRGVFHERAGIAEVLYVFSCRALAGLAAARDSFGPRAVQRVFAALVKLFEIGADCVEVDVLGLALCFARHVSFLDEGERRVFEHGVAGCDREFPQDAADIGLDHMLHFHGFHHEHRFARAHGASRRHGQVHDRALQRCEQWRRAVRTFCF